jgi:hypothetical protein
VSISTPRRLLGIKIVTCDTLACTFFVALLQQSHCKEP